MTVSLAICKPVGMLFFVETPFDFNAGSSSEGGLGSYTVNGKFAGKLFDSRVDESALNLVVPSATVSGDFLVQT